MRKYILKDDVDSIVQAMLGEGDVGIIFAERRDIHDLAAEFGLSSVAVSKILPGSPAAKNGQVRPQVLRMMTVCAYSTAFKQIAVTQNMLSHKEPDIAADSSWGCHYRH